LKPQHDEPLSDVAFSFNLRRYTQGLAGVHLDISPADAEVLLVGSVNQFRFVLLLQTRVKACQLVPGLLRLNL